MALPTRSEREMDLGRGLRRTPSVVGPGSYLGHAELHVPQGRTPFSSSSQRHDMGMGKAYLPGPGQYEPAQVVTSPTSRRGTAALACTVDRMPPTGAPSSGVGCSTYMASPGPGQYRLTGAWGRATRNAGAGKSACSLAVSGTEETPVAIPIPGKHFGYRVDSATGKLRRVADPNQGRGEVGPGAYLDPDKRDPGRQTSFGQASTRPCHFVRQSVGVPGPGTYQPHLPSSDSSARGGTSAFLSKVPQHLTTDEASAASAAVAAAAEMIAAAAREAAAADDAAATGTQGLAGYSQQRDAPASVPAPNRGGAGGDLCRSRSQVGFGSTTNRSEVVATRHDTPFAVVPIADRLSTPGPGSYLRTKRNCRIREQMRRREREQDYQVGFGSTAPRPFLKEDRPRTSHGDESSTPACAEDQFEARPSTAEYNRRAPGDLRPFGVTSKKTSVFDDMADSFRDHPGPGEYTPLVTEMDRQRAEAQEMQRWQEQVQDAVAMQIEIQLDVETTLHMNDPRPQLCPRVKPRPRIGNQGSAAFRSQTNRFGDSSGAARARRGRNTSEMDAQQATWVPKGRVMGTRAGANKRQEPAVGSANFRSTRARFNGSDSAFGDLNKRAELPGPGQYGTSKAAAGARRRGRGPVWRGKDDRFRDGKTASGKVGPGAYNVAGNMIKKSHNVTMV